MIASISNGGSHGPPHQPHQTLHHQHLRPRSRRSDQPARRRPVALGRPWRTTGAAACRSTISSPSRATGSRGSTGGQQEAAINALPQFTTEIDGQTFHFVHVKSRQSRRPADRPLPRLAGVVRRVPAARRAADQRWVRRRDPVPSRASAFRRRSPRTAGTWRGRRMPMPRSCRGWATRSTARTAATSAPGSRGISRRSIPTGSIGVHVASERNTLSNAGVFLPLPDDLERRREGRGRCDQGGDARTAMATARQQGTQAADAGLRSCRLAGRPARLDRREVQGVDRRRARPAGGRGRPRPAAHQCQPLLVHQHRRIVGPVLLGEHALERAAGRRHPTCRPDGRCSTRRRSSGGCSTPSTSTSTGPTSPSAVTSRRWSSRRCSPATSRPSSRPSR